MTYISHLLLPLLQRQETSDFMIVTKSNIMQCSFLEDNIHFFYCTCAHLQKIKKNKNLSQLVFDCGRLEMWI